MKTRIAGRPGVLGLAAVTLASGLLLAGCAGNPPTDQLAATNAVMKSAEAAGAPQYAPMDYRSAQDKLAQAQVEMQTQHYDRARTLAEQAEWDARVAERKAMATKAEKAYQDAQRGVQDLRQEGQRSTIIVQ
jgi:hypothetical protein